MNKYTQVTKVTNALFVTKDSKESSICRYMRELIHLKSHSPVHFVNTDALTQVI